MSDAVTCTVEADAPSDCRPAADASPKGLQVAGEFAACKVGGMLLLKLIGFIQDERAEILEVSDEHIVLQLGQPWHLRWWHGVERRRPIKLRLDFSDSDEDLPDWRKTSARRSLVKVDIRPMTRSFRECDFKRRADALLRSLRLHFVAD